MRWAAVAVFRQDEAAPVRSGAHESQRQPVANGRICEKWRLKQRKRASPGIGPRITPMFRITEAVDGGFLLLIRVIRVIRRSIRRFQRFQIVSSTPARQGFRSDVPMTDKRTRSEADNAFSPFSPGGRQMRKSNLGSVSMEGRIPTAERTSFFRSGSGKRRQQGEGSKGPAVAQALQTAERFFSMAARFRSARLRSMAGRWTLAANRWRWMAHVRRWRRRWLSTAEGRWTSVRPFQSSQKPSDDRRPLGRSSAAIWLTEMRSGRTLRPSSHGQHGVH